MRAVPWSELPARAAAIVAQAIAPVPRSSASPRARRALFGRGPIVVSGRGGVDLGTRRSTQNAVVQSANQYGGALTVSAERRTDRAAISIVEGLSIGSNGSGLGQVQVGYTTPDYAAEYGQIAGPAQTQLQIGGFVRGLRIRKPRPDGGFELLFAAALGSTGQGYTAWGGRYTRATSRSELALTGLRARRQGGGADDTIGAIGYRRFGTGGTTVVEAALSVPHGDPVLADGVHAAFALSRDFTFRGGYGSARFIDVPTGFASLNGAQVPGNTFDLTLRRDFGRLNLGFNAQRAYVNGGTQREVSQRATLLANLGARRSNVSVTTSIASDDINGARAITTSAGVTLSQTLRGLTLSEAVQTARVRSADVTSTTNGLALSVGARAAGGFVTLTFGRGSASDSVNLSQYQQRELNYTRAIGAKTDFTSSIISDVQRQNGLATTVDTYSAGIIRRLSPSLAARVQLQRNRSSGASFNAGNLIAIDLVGPLAFGAGARTDLRGDPRLPAVVRGHVYVLSGSDVTAAAAQQRGLGNALVVLDNTVTQRTDATGAYEFRFVKAGLHTVSIETGSLPSGYLSDRRSDVVKVVGGGVGTLDFGVGRFAGVGGRIYQATREGRRGIPGLSVTVDGTYSSVTDGDGRWSIGRLSPGTHRVDVSLANAPTSIAFEKPPQATVQVLNGAITPVDFVAQTLASISGQVVNADPNDASKFVGVPDVYVVANPGDHAAITNTDGSFILDNVPPGEYTVAADKDTLPEGAGPNAPVPVSLAPGAHVEHLTLTLTAEEKNVVFTFKAGKKSALVATFDLPHAPPGALVRLSVMPSKETRGPVTAETDALRKLVLARDAGGAFAASFVVPPTAHGELPFDITSPGGTTLASLTVDPAIPLIAVRSVPSHPQPNRALHLSLRILAPVTQGDLVRFDDAPAVKLPKPHGRTYELDIRTGSRGVLNGTVIAKDGHEYFFTVR